MIFFFFSVRGPLHGDAITFPPDVQHLIRGFLIATPCWFISEAQALADDLTSLDIRAAKFLNGFCDASVGA